MKPLQLILLALLLLPLATPAGARDFGERRSPRAAAPERGYISPDQAARSVRDATGGRVLGIRRNGPEADPEYRVKVLRSGGRVQVLRVDPRSGRLLK